MSAPNPATARPAGAWLAVGLPAVLALLIGAGWLITHQWAHDWPFTVEDSVDRTLETHRTGFLDEVSAFFSTVADTAWTIALAALAVVLTGIAYRRWREPLFIAVTLVSQLAVFLATTLVIDRPRPAVPHLDRAPPTSSFPSGHVAAAVALYGAVVLIARRHGARWPVWLLIAMPFAVGASRLYRGMHHPSDVVAGLLLGTLCVSLAWLEIMRAAPRRPVPRGRRWPPAPAAWRPRPRTGAPGPRSRGTGRGGR